MGAFASPTWKRVFVRLFPPLALVALGASCFAQVPARSDAPIWSGQSGGFALRWTTGDLTAAPVGQPSKVIFSAKEQALRRFAEFKKENLETEPSWRCSYSLKFTVLSFAGSLLSYQETEDSYCGRPNGPGWNHPSIQTSYRVIDLNKPDVPVSLARFFAEEAVLGAVLSDSTIKQALKNAGKPAEQKNIADLVKTINEETSIQPLKGTPEAPKDCGFVFPEHPFTEFAFHHLEKGNVAIRLSLVPNSGACHSAHSQLGILLPAPAALAESLTAAHSRTQGFLMQDSRRLSGNKATLFEFETAPSKQTRKR
jgi:hypothetical protein